MIGFHPKAKFTRYADSRENFLLDVALRRLLPVWPHPLNEIDPLEIIP